MSSTIHDIDHPAASILAEFRDQGVPVVVTDAPWSQEKLAECLARGAHQSAKTHKVFVREEMGEYIQDGHWLVLPYHMVKDLPNLHLSPLGVKEERDRRPRLVVDHTFYEINDNTQVLVPLEAMQFGGALERLLYRIRHADPAHGPVYICKFDISDGFYRLHLRPSDAPALASSPRTTGRNQW